MSSLLPIAAGLAPGMQKYLLRARQMQALSFPAHIHCAALPGQRGHSHPLPWSKRATSSRRDGLRWGQRALSSGRPRKPHRLLEPIDG